MEYVTIFCEIWDGVTFRLVMSSYFLNDMCHSKSRENSHVTVDSPWDSKHEIIYVSLSFSVRALLSYIKVRPHLTHTFVSTSTLKSKVYC